MNTFNNKFVNNWKDLNNSQVGLEFEFYSNHSYIKTLELLNIEFNPIEIWGINQYHSNFNVTDKIFKIEPDYSGGSDMVELITGPMNWITARIILIKVLNFIKINGYTNDYCSLHINISFNNLDVKQINLVKLLLNINEDFIYDKFPTRRNNIYAKSIKQIIPFDGFEDSEIALNHIIDCLQLPDDTKYYGINLQKKWKGYLEYRYIGGEHYENKVDNILTLMDYFIIQTKNAIVNPLLPEDNIKLLSYLDDNINWFKQYKTYDDFLANIDGIDIQVDKITDYNIIKSSWDKFGNKLFDIIQSCELIKDATINYNNTSNRLEVIYATIKNVHYLKNIDFIECTINDCVLYNCDIIDSTIDNGHIYNSNIYESIINNTKLTNCKALEWSELNKCMFDGGTLNCIMKDGVFRSGIIGEDADIDITVKMANSDTFWKIGPQNKKIKGLDK